MNCPARLVLLKLVSFDRSLLKGEAPRFRPSLSCERPLNCRRHLIQDWGSDEQILLTVHTTGSGHPLTPHWSFQFCWLIVWRAAQWEYTFLCNSFHHEEVLQVQSNVGNCTMTCWWQSLRRCRDYCAVLNTWQNCPNSMSVPLSISMSLYCQFLFLFPCPFPFHVGFCVN